MKNWRFLCWCLFWLVCFPAAVTFANIIDNSVNQPSFPPSLTLLATVDATPSRQNITVQNQSADTIEVWRDQDCAGTQLSLILLSPVGAGSQGANWSSKTFKGCVRVYGNSGDQVSIYQD